LIDKARNEVASFLGASSREIIFTSGATEANNTVIRGIINNKDHHIITCKIDHPSIINPCKYMESMGYKVSYISVDKYGIIDLSELESAISTKTRLISVIMASNEIGTIQPIKEISAIAKKHNILFHTDAVQAIAKIDVNVDKLGIDLLTLSAHKCGGPKGVGVLYIRKGINISPLLHGGGHERGQRSGTENTIGIIALGELFKISKDSMANNVKRMLKLRDRLEKAIFDNIPNVVLNGHPTKRLPNTLNISFQSIEGEATLLSLDMVGISVSSGSACSSGYLEPSYVIMALGKDFEIAHSSIRFSIGNQNTDKEIDYVIERLPKLISNLRKVSPLGLDNPFLKG
jgi:cysteine desulfurase